MSDESEIAEEAAGAPGRRGWLRVLGVFFVLSLALFFALPYLVPRLLNGVYEPFDPASVSEVARERHFSSVVMDLHADALLWNRDLAVRGSYGQVDVPRLIEGNIALQGFTIVTKTPLKMGYQDIPEPPDVMIRALVMAQGWPRATWDDLQARAIYQCERLDALAARCPGQFRVIRSRRQLEDYLKERASNPKQTAGFLGVEGLHSLSGQIERIDELFAAGVRMAAPTHFFDTELGGSAHGLSQAGLTEFGKKCLLRMQEIGIAIDLAHASAAVIEEACALATKPVLISHTGVKRSFDSPRNLSDESLKAIAKTGGVVGIGFFSAATGGEDIASIVRAMKATIDLIGVDHVALGSDWDGSVKTPFDAAAIPSLTEALIEAGFSEADVAKILGLNVLRVLRETLPKSGD